MADRFRVDVDLRVDEATPVFVISVAAQLAGMHPQTLRQYDRLGLVSPGRTAGRGRRYSARDIGTLREVQRLSQEEGVFAGVSTGANVVGALRLAEQLGPDAVVVTLAVDSGFKYMTGVPYAGL